MVGVAGNAAALMQAAGILQDLATAMAGIREAAVAEFFQCGKVSLAALALVEGLSIPEQAVGFELPENGIFGTGQLAGGVNILHAYQPGSTLRFCIKIAGQRGNQ